MVHFQQGEEVVQRAPLLPESVTAVDDNNAGSTSAKTLKRGCQGKSAQPVKADANDADDKMPGTSRKQPQVPTRRTLCQPNKKLKIRRE